MIMKKNYLKPETVMVDVVLCNMIATSGDSGNSENEMPVLPGEKEEFSGRHRGEWGNVWGK